MTNQVQQMGCLWRAHTLHQEIDPSVGALMLLRKEGLSFLRSWPTRVAWLSSLPSALVQKPRQIQPLNHPSFHAFHRSIAVPARNIAANRADIVTKKVATLTLQPLTIALFRRDSDVCTQKPHGSQETAVQFRHKRRQCHIGTRHFSCFLAINHLSGGRPGILQGSCTRLSREFS